MMKKCSKLALKAPGEASEILLHTCCAPCSTAIIERLIEHGIRPKIFFYNPNIFPQEEYQRRKNECVRYVKMMGFDFIDADYAHEKWLKEVQGLEKEPERGVRCLACFKERLTVAALYAHEHGYRVLATTLASSRWKDLEQIEEAGAYATSFFPGLTFWAYNWRKDGLSERRNELVRFHGLYNQSYCGCEYSTDNQRVAKMI